MVTPTNQITKEKRKKEGTLREKVRKIYQRRERAGRLRRSQYPV